jgi:hypothetical protein
VTAARFHRYRVNGRGKCLAARHPRRIPFHSFQWVDSADCCVGIQVLLGDPLIPSSIFVFDDSGRSSYPIQLFDLINESQRSDGSKTSSKKRIASVVAEVSHDIARWQLHKVIPKLAFTQFISVPSQDYPFNSVNSSFFYMLCCTQGVWGRKRMPQEQKLLPVFWTILLTQSRYRPIFVSQKTLSEHWALRRTQVNSLPRSCPQTFWDRAQWSRPGWRSTRCTAPRGNTPTRLVINFVMRDAILLLCLSRHVMRRLGI